MRSYLPLIWKDYPWTHIYGLKVYMEEVLPFLQDLSLEESRHYLARREGVGGGIKAMLPVGKQVLFQT